MAWIQIGKIGPPQGLSGSFFLVGGDTFESAMTESAVMGDDPDCGIPISLARSVFSKGHWILKIHGIEDRKALEDVRGQKLWIEALEQKHELAGTSIVDGSGTQLGFIVDVDNHGASDIAVVRSASNTSIDLPLVPDYFDFPPQNNTLILKIPASELADLWYA